MKEVVSLELSKKLKENGYPQEGHFWWASHNKKNYVLTCNQIGFTLEEWKHCDRIVAPTVAELGEILPGRIEGIGFIRTIKWSNDKFSISIGNIYEQNADSEANARAKMFICLLENNLRRIYV